MLHARSPPPRHSFRASDPITQVRLASTFCR